MSNTKTHASLVQSMPTNMFTYSNPDVGTHNALTQADLANLISGKTLVSLTPKTGGRNNQRTFGYIPTSSLANQVYTNFKNSGNANPTLAQFNQVYTPYASAMTNSGHLADNMAGVLALSALAPGIAQGLGAGGTAAAGTSGTAETTGGATAGSSAIPAGGMTATGSTSAADLAAMGGSPGVASALPAGGMTATGTAAGLTDAGMVGTGAGATGGAAGGAGGAAGIGGAMGTGTNLDFLSNMAIANGISGILGAGASIYGANQAAKGNQAALAQQQGMFNTINGQQQPFMQGGYSALNSINAGLQPGGQFTHQFNASDLNANLAPNYQFMLNQGLGATANQANAQGGLGGNEMKAINDYAQNYAGNAYQQAFSNYTTNQNNIFNRLSSIAGLGQNAAANVGNQGTTLAGNMGQAASNIGNANSAGTIGASNAIGGGLSGAAFWSGLGSSNGNPLAGYMTNGSGTALQ